uniref:F-box domain-containing protein n=1 Tax=Globodera pallida TaxID=36090 RepID=A0A183CJ56_GLOPA
MSTQRVLRKKIQKIRERSGGRPLSIPQESLPGRVIGFEEICYIDRSVFEFLQRFFDSFGTTTIYIRTCDNQIQSRSWQIIWQKIWPLVSDNICCFLRLNSSQLGSLRQISPAILRNCTKLRSINSVKLFPEFPAEDNAGASSAQALAKWLLTPRGDGLPKMLICEFNPARIDELKWAFANALEPANFIIRPHFSGIGPFQLMNNWTGERLSLRRLKNKWLLVRCPIEREEDKWTNWEGEAIEDIGDGMLD